MANYIINLEFYVKIHQCELRSSTFYSEQVCKLSSSYSAQIYIYYYLVKYKYLWEKKLIINYII